MVVIVRRPVDLLPLMRTPQGNAPSDGNIQVNEYETRSLDPFVISPGWWCATAVSDCGPIFLELWGAETGDFASLRLTSSSPRLFRSSGGRIDASLCFGPVVGNIHLKSLRLEPVRRYRIFVEFLIRSIRILASFDFGRMRRAIVAGLNAVPITLRPPLDQSMHSNAGPGLSCNDFVVNVFLDGADGGDREGTLASLRAQQGIEWRLSNRDSTGDLAVRLMAGDRLAPDALSLMSSKFKNPSVSAVYADASFRGTATSKPEWDAELAMHYDYVGRPLMWRGSHAPQFEDQIHQMRELAAANRSSIVRTPLVLLESPEAPASLEPARPAAPVFPALISIVTPTRDRPEIIGPFLDNLLGRSERQDFELILVDNGTREAQALRLIEAHGRDPRLRVVRIDGPFNYSALSNAGARLARGDILVLLNNDVEPLTNDWLTHLSSTAMRPEVGAVGPLLLYPDHTVQHAGVGLGIGGVAGHPWKGFPGAEVDNHVHLALPQQRSALTAACIAMRRSVFIEAGGLDELHLPVTLNDIDLCLKIAALNLRLVFDPRVRLIHHESRSRPSDRQTSQRARVISEQNIFRSRWRSRILNDPFYSPALTRAEESGARRV